MAVGHYEYDDQTVGGRLVRKLMNGVETVLDTGDDLLKTGAQMIDGDGSDAAHFTYFAEHFGFETNAIAKAAWEELNSLLSKFRVDTAVTSVNAAMLQAVAKFR